MANRFLSVLLFSSLVAHSVRSPSQTKPLPVPAPPNTLLVARTCAVAWVSGPKRAQRFLADGIHDIWGTSQACNGSFNERELLVAGEYRLFMHLWGIRSKVNTIPV
jgi:hypothetical protein